MSLNVTGPCQLHIPHKDWADDPAEKQNYEAIEQWSYRLPNCFEAAGPDPGGAVTVHRATYGWSHGYYGPPVVAGAYTFYNSIPSGAGNLYWDWGNTALTADALNVNGCFGTDPNGRIGHNGYVPIIPINKSGLLSWHAILDGSSMINGQWSVNFVDYNAKSNLQTETSVVAPSAGGPIVSVGGGYYVPAGTQLVFYVNQFTGTTSVFSIRMMMTLLEF